MKAIDIIKQDNEMLVKKLIENMQKGYVFKPDWDVEVLRPQNPVSSTLYKGLNKLKLMVQALDKEYDDPRWLTFNQAKENGWSVKKGEKGTRCVKVITKEKVKEKDEKTGEMVEVEKQLAKPMINYFTVFNANQIEGIPPLERIKADKGQISEIINDVIASAECPIKILAQDRAFYSPVKDEIVLPLRESFKNEESFLATALHEIGHSTGHESRLNREQLNAFGSPEYAKEELVAELCAVFTQARLNVKLEGEHFNNHTAYLESWIKELQNDPNQLFILAKEADKASDRIYNNYLEREKEIIKQLDKDIANAEKEKANNLAEEKEKVNNLAEEKERRFFRGLIINFNWSEKDFGIKDDSIMRASEAYRFLDKLVKADLEQNKIQKMIDEGKDVEGLYYYKTSLNFSYKGYKTGNIRIDLGDLEFGGKEKVSDALEHRLKLFPNEVLENKEQWAKAKETTVDEIVASAKTMLSQIDEIMKSFRKQESLYLEYLEQKKSKEKEVPLEKADPWKRKDKETSLEKADPWGRKDKEMSLEKENPWSKKVEQNRNLTLGLDN